MQGLRLWAQRQHLQVCDIHCIYQLKEKTLRPPFIVRVHGTYR